MTWHALIFFLQLIAFIHTVLVNSKKTKVHTCMVVAPLNTILNWQYEFEMWQEFTKKEVDVRSLRYLVLEPIDQNQLLIRIL